MDNFYNKARMCTSMHARVYDGTVHHSVLKEAS